jgi:hypothetical protein
VFLAHFLRPCEPDDYFIGGFLASANFLFRASCLAFARVGWTK